MGIQAGLEYMLIDAFNTGNAPLDTEAKDLQSLFLSVGLSYRFGR